MTENRYLYEYVLKIETERYVTRIWCEISQTLKASMTVKAQNATFGDADMVSTVSELCAVEGVNSVEILDKLDNVAVCVHKNWP